MSNTSNKSGIGKQIKKYRQAAGMSQQQLADEIGYKSGTAVSLIESGARGVDANDLPRIAEALHVNITALVGDKNEVPKFTVALRADGDLDDSDKKEILNFYNYVKDRKRRK